MKRIILVLAAMSVSWLSLSSFIEAGEWKINLSPGYAIPVGDFKDFTAESEDPPETFKYPLRDLLPFKFVWIINLLRHRHWD